MARILSGVTNPTDALSAHWISDGVNARRPLPRSIGANSNASVRRGRSVLETREGEESQNAREKLRTIKGNARRWLRRDRKRLASGMLHAARGDQGRGAFMTGTIANFMQPLVQLRGGGKAGRQSEGDDQKRRKNSPRRRHWRAVCLKSLSCATLVRQHSNNDGPGVKETSWGFA